MSDEINQPTSEELLRQVLQGMGKLAASVEGVRSDMTAGIASVREEMRTDSKAVRDLIKKEANTQAAAHAATRKHMARLTTITTELWKFNFGDKPPPPPPTSSDEELAFALSEPDPEILAAVRRTGRNKAASISESGMVPAASSSHLPARERLESTEATLDALHGIVMRVDAEVQEVKGVAAETLKLQKEQMGKRDRDPAKGVVTRIVDALIWSVKEREGQKFVMILIGGLTSLVTASAYLYALATGHPPPRLTTPPGAATHEPASP